MYDPEIFVAMSSSMTVIQKFVSSKYFFYQTDTVPFSKINKIVWSFDDRFNLKRPRGARDHVRKQGQATFRLVLFPNPLTLDITFWLLRNKGTHPLMATEQWTDARKSPIQWPFLYELRQIPVPPDLRDKYKRLNGKVAINPVTWTWRIRREEMETMRFNIRRWVEQRDERIAQLIRGLSVAPPHRGIRSDVYDLHEYIALQHRKRKKKPPHFSTINWTTGKTGKSYPLSYVTKRFDRGTDTWFPSSSRRTDTTHLLVLTKPTTVTEIEHVASKTSQDNSSKADD